MLDLEYAQLSDTGRLRTHNEDYLGSCRPETPDEGRSHGWLFALADGVGGNDRGEVASRTAVEHMLASFHAAAHDEPLAALIVKIIRAANQHVYEVARQATPGGSNMATTIVSCALRFDRAVVAHAGDSRCYLVREGRATLLTRDHTLSDGKLTRSLGRDLFLNVETSEHQIHPDDALLLCCDGLHRSVTETDIAAIAAAEPDVKAAASQLVALANQRDGSDNISVQLIRIRSVERIGFYRGRPYKLR